MLEARNCTWTCLFSSSSSWQHTSRKNIFVLVALVFAAVTAADQLAPGTGQGYAGRECLNTSVAVLIPASPSLHHELKEKILRNARNLVSGSPELCVHIFMDGGPLSILGEDQRPLSKTSRLRNRMIDSLNLTEWDYILWIDADVVEFPPNLPALLIEENPDGVTAPVVLIEEPGPVGPNQFYDTTAFTLKGRSSHAPQDNTPYVAGRSVELFYPWVPGGLEEDLVDVDGVGTVYIIPAHVFRKGIRYEDHPRLTEHWSVISRVHAMGLPVKMHRGIIVRHANLPNYGIQWHSNDIRAA